MPNRIRWQGDADSVRSDGMSDRDEYDRSSYDSNRSYSTAHTAYSPTSTPKPPLQRHVTCFGRVESHRSDLSFNHDERRASVDTYASTDASDLEDEDDDEDAYELVDAPEEQYQSDAIPAMPRDFAELFPSSRRLSIHHDDSTVDGNMNLRVDTLVETEWSSQKENITLFHLKMNDLKSREFSLRRYCRDSGREVCKTIRKYHTPSQKHRPTLTKSFTSAFANLKKHHEDSAPQMPHLRRNDSGYGSVFAQALDDAKSIQEPKESKLSKRLPTNTVKFEFSNYATVEVKRRGTGATKGYQFEYWGHDYTWKRKVKQEGDFEEVSFHLIREDKSTPLAHIVPVPLTREQAREEKQKGGWIPRCSMWITDADVTDGSPDIAE
jgi:hypothetical protein